MRERCKQEFASHVLEKDGFLVPATAEDQVKNWLDCAWTRIPCNKDSCPLCGRINRGRERLWKEGKDPDSVEAALDSVGATFVEVAILLKQEADRLGIDIENLEEIEDTPDADAFPLSKSVKEWYLNLQKAVHNNFDTDAPWLATEAAHDLLWYAGTFSAKVYRQECNVWHKERGDTYGDFDYEYTAGVLKQVVEILDRSWPVVLDLAPHLNPHEKTYRALIAKTIPFFEKRN